MKRYNYYKTHPSQEELKSDVIYDPESGSFTKQKNGKLMGSSLNWAGYSLLYLRGKSYRAHVIAWIYMTGGLPNLTIDHINKIPNDNRWCNLREADMYQQNGNMGKQPRNRSGIRGVSYSSTHRHPWQAKIRIQQKTVHLGYFDTKEEAAKAYNRAAKEYFGEFYTGA